MKKSSRVLLLAIVFELLIVAIGAWLLIGLASGDLRPSTTAADARTTVLSVLGGVMGVIAVVCGVTWFVLRQRGQ